MHRDELKVFSELAPGQNKNVSDRLAEQLKDKIVSGELHSGYVFPNENELCALLKVGRGTLREAYKVLNTMGYVSRTKNGTRVNDVKEIAAKGSFNASVEFSNYCELIEFVLVLEAETAALAAKKASHEELREIETELELCDKYLRDLPTLRQCNRRFHDKVRLAAQNHLMTSAMAASLYIFEKQVIMRLYREHPGTREFMIRAVNQHHELYEKLCQHDSEGAKRIARAHMLASVERLHEMGLRPQWILS